MRRAEAREEGIHHDQKLHDVVVHRRAGRLSKKNIIAAYVFA